MPGRLPYVKRRKYPHMIAEEVVIWERFVDLFPNRFDSVDYDFRIGVGQQMELDFPENYGRMVTMLTQHRIDVLGWVGEQPTIVEVKDRAILSTIGQMIGYRTLFVKDYNNLKIPNLLCVCGSISRDVITVFTDQQFPWVIV
jgi:hypothetical protein